MDVIVGGVSGEPLIVGADEIIGRTLKNLGVRSRHRVTRGGVEYQCMVPAHLMPHRREVLVRHHEPFPTVVSGKIGRKIKKGLKTAVKKIAKNKVVKTLVNSVLDAAEQVPGYGSAVKAGRTAIKSVAKSVKQAKRAGAAKAKLPSGAASIVARAAALAPSKSSAAPKGGRIVTTRSGKRFLVSPV